MRTKEEILQGENERSFHLSCYLDFEKFYTRVLGMEVMPFHRDWIKILREHKKIAISAPVGFGKCFGKGTEILMHNGSIKKVEDIVPNDLLMGDDSNPRKVSTIIKGYDNLYKVIQKNGDDYIVNEPHILSLRMSYGAGWKKKNEIVDISIKDYLNKSKTFRWAAKGFKVPVDFKKKKIDIDPYFLGLWLGDGCHLSPSIFSMDFEIERYLYSLSEKLNMRLSVTEMKGCKKYSLVYHKNRKNKMTECLRRYNLIRNKHIPNDFKINSKEVRLKVLAGLIDSDGYVKNKVITITQKRKELSEDIVYLARSLGFRVSFREKVRKIKKINFSGNYYEIIISGHTDMIPTIINRKNSKERKLNKNPLNTGITLETNGFGEYFGFEIEGVDKRFLLKDFTVVHNTMLFGIGYPLWLAYYKPKSESLIISNSLKQSADIMEETKITIESNEMLRELIPKDMKTSWTKSKMIMSTFATIKNCVNSKNVRGNHPDYEFCDELANYDDHEVFWRDVASRIDNKKGILACVSTPVDVDDLLAQAMNKPSFFSKFYPALVDKNGIPDAEKGESIWPTKFSKKELLGIRRDSISDFEKNYMVNPKAESENPFITYASVEDCFDITLGFTQQTEGGKVYMGCDFAYSTGPRADYTVFTIVEYVGTKVIIRHIERHRGMPIDTQKVRIRELRHIYNPLRIVMDESNVGQGFVQEMRSEGFPIEAQSFHSLARRKLLIDLKSVIDNKMLVIPRDKEDPLAFRYSDILTTEIIKFSDVKSKSTQNRILKSSAAHDDTVVSLAMACKGAQVVTRPFKDCMAFGN